MKLKLQFFLPLLLILLFTYCRTEAQQKENQNRWILEVHSTSDNFPADKTIDASFFFPSRHLADTILKHDYLTVAYSTKNKNPEWTLYVINEKREVTDLAARKSNFVPDPLLPISVPSTNQYASTGFDRGHLVPAEDMNFSEKAMSESFYMSNVSPQHPSFNRGLWKRLENKVREWAALNDHMVVISGAVLTSETNPGFDKMNGIDVPKFFYKIILDYQQPEVKAIAFIMPNEKREEEIAEFACTIRKVEELTKINFFPKFNTAESKEIEEKIDLKKWGF
jgi:endonuclease G